MAGSSTVPAEAEGPDAVQAQREEVLAQEVALAAEVDVLTADRAEVDAALDALDANVDAAQAKLAQVTDEAERARDREAEARTDAARIEGELSLLDAELQDMAVEAFIGGDKSALGIALVVRANDAAELARIGYLAGLEVERQDVVAARLARVQVAMATARTAAEAAAVDTARVVDDVTHQVVALEEARAVQADFLARVEAELERRLAEAAGLERLDAKLAEQIRREEEALAARLAAAAAEAAAAQAQALAEQALAGGAGAWDTAGAGTVRPLPQGSGDLVRVGSFVVDASIGDALAAMLAEASAEGLTFGGGAYRDAAAQIERRRANCGTSDDDVYAKPASQCRPPTARPGFSMHERGLAIDFTVDGSLISTRSNPGYRWLAANAGRFGFRNLPSEPWHWSTNGQ